MPFIMVMYMYSVFCFIPGESTSFYLFVYLSVLYLCLVLHCVIDTLYLILLRFVLVPFRSKKLLTVLLRELNLL